MRDKLIRTLASIDNGTFVEPHSLTVGEWMTYWLENHKKLSLRENTYDSYEKFIRLHIVPYIGHIKLAKLKPADLQQFYKKLLESGRVGQSVNRKEKPEKPVRLTKDGRPFKSGPPPKEKTAKEESKGLSIRSVRYTHALLHSALKQAMKENLIKTLPTLACTLPREEKKEMKTMPADAIPRFLAAARNGPYFTLYYLALVSDDRLFLMIYEVVTQLCCWLFFIPSSRVEAAVSMFLSSFAPILMMFSRRI